MLDASLSQQEATLVLTQTLKRLGATEPLCFSAHGNDLEIGDADDHWTWTYGDIAGMLENGTPGYKGSILIHACASQIVNFSSNLAVALENLSALNGTWAYGYNRPLASNAAFPPPDKLAQQVDLQGTQVVVKSGG
ncbi:MAG: hypothetical protein JO040_00155 [Gemmatimonadetes bacterium]|nr:hypothetical protein [Gemmatimonadota bacterium]